MRKYIFSVLIALLSLPVIAQQQQSQAKVILDKTAEAFRKAGGVKVDFTVKAVTNGLVEGVENGTIQLKGEKFVLKTSDIITWFDGKTQWSYMTKNDEVNVIRHRKSCSRLIRIHFYICIRKDSLISWEQLRCIVEKLFGKSF